MYRGPRRARTSAGCIGRIPGRQAGVRTGPNARHAAGRVIKNAQSYQRQQRGDQAVLSHVLPQFIVFQGFPDGSQHNFRRFYCKDTSGVERRMSFDMDPGSGDGLIFSGDRADKYREENVCTYRKPGRNGLEPASVDSSPI